MAVKQWSVGQVLASADMNAWTVPLVGLKASDTTRTNNTQSNDPDLALAVAANASYYADCWLNYEGFTQGSSDLKIGFAVPASATLRASADYTNSSGGAVTEVYYTSGGAALNAGTNGLGNIRGFKLHGTLITGASSGTFALSWAQVTTNATGTIVHTGSCLKLVRIG